MDMQRAAFTSVDHPVDYKDYYSIPEPITLGPQYRHYFPPPRLNKIVQTFLKNKGINAKLFTPAPGGDFEKNRDTVCRKFAKNHFNIKKCLKPDDSGVVAFFPPLPYGRQELENFVFKTPFDGDEQDNLKRVFYAQAVNAHLRSIGVTSMRAPQKYLISIPGGNPSVYTDANYKVISEKINIADDRGNVFDLINPEDLRTLLYEVVLRFGLCDLHIESSPQDRNVVYDNQGTIIFIDTESLGDRLGGQITEKNFDNDYFRADKGVLPEELFIAQELLADISKSYGPDGYSLGRTLARWIHVLNMGLITLYKYYNFDISFPAPQCDTAQNNPDRTFDFMAFEEHRRVVCECIHDVMKKIILCAQEIEEKYPDIRDKSLADIAPLSEDGSRKLKDKKDGSMFSIVPIKEYLRVATKRIAGEKSIYRDNPDGSERCEKEYQVEIPGLVFFDGEAESFVRSPVITPEKKRTRMETFKTRILPRQMPMATMIEGYDRQLARFANFNLQVALRKLRARFTERVKFKGMR